MKKQKHKNISFIPSAPAPDKEPWKTTFIDAQVVSVPNTMRSRPADLMAVSRANGAISAGLHWVYKKRWNSKHKIPPGAKNEEALGDFLHSILSLCMELHSMHRLGENYKNAGIWFLCICDELKRNGYESSQARHSKTDDVAWLKNQGAKLRQFQNPIDPKTDRHTWSLYQAGIDIAYQGCFPDIFRDLWNGSTKVRGFHRPGLIPAITAFARHRN